MQDHCHSHNLAINTSNLSSAYTAEDQSEANVVVTWPIGNCLAKPVFEISTDEPVLKETAQDLGLGLRFRARVSGYGFKSIKEKKNFSHPLKAFSPE